MATPTPAVPSDVLALASALIARHSVTPCDAGCLTSIASLLEPLGFVCERLDSGVGDLRVSNLWAYRAASRHGAKTLVFAGHVDVVPSGPPEQWRSPPFTPTVADGKLYGRGASDMKSSIAAYIVALQSYLGAQPDTPLNLALLLTSDEEGPATDGTIAVCHALQQRGTPLHYCIVGEPTAVARTGDMLKNGRRGTMSGRLTVHGIQGHIAYPQLAKNPIHMAAPALAELAATQWDAGNAHFPPTSWQISNIHGGTGASNVIPGHVVVDFNFRFSTESTPEALQQRLEAILQRHGLDYTLDWVIGGHPFLTPPGELVNAVQAAICTVTGQTAELSTSGGTSDGRFIARICPEVIELGPPNASIHKIDEHIALDDLHTLQHIYQHCITQLADRQTDGAGA